MTAGASLHQLVEGSLLVISGVENDPEVAAALVDELVAVVGHDRFVVLWLPAGEGVEVWSVDDDLVARVSGLLEAGGVAVEARGSEQVHALTGVPDGARAVPLPPAPSPDDQPGVPRRIPVVDGPDDDEVDGDG